MFKVNKKDTRKTSLMSLHAVILNRFCDMYLQLDKAFLFTILNYMDLKKTISRDKSMILFRMCL